MKKTLLAILIVLGLTVSGLAQTTPQVGGAIPTQLAPALYALTAISSTGAVNTQTTLTIPAPPAGQYNYVCYLAYQLGNDNTGTAVSNVVSTSTNFGSFAVKVSQVATASTDTGVIPVLTGAPGTGCSKSTSAGTATTFVSPASVTHSAWTWYATYFQAP